MRGGQGTNPNGSGTLLSLWNCMEELSKIIQRGRKNHLIIRAARQLEDRNSYELIDDLGINSDDMSCNSGLKHQPSVIVLHHFKVGIE
jgi:hypothetical protein